MLEKWVFSLIVLSYDAICITEHLHELHVLALKKMHYIFSESRYHQTLVKVF